VQRRGVGGMTVGLISSVVLAMIGPAMRGADALWPLVNPAVVSLPLGFLGAYLGTVLYGRDMDNEKRFDAFLIQVHTGVSPAPSTISSRLLRLQTKHSRATAKSSPRSGGSRRWPTCRAFWHH
jgi:hypothetical protein